MRLFPETVAIVPARFASTRLPGKPLADIAGVPLIIRVLGALSGAGIDRIIAAVDDPRIEDVVLEEGYEAVLTGPAASGSERVYNAWKKLGRPGERIINVQGDEPLVCRAWIDALVSVPPEDDLVVTLAAEIELRDAGHHDLVKAVTDSSGMALYFSRAAVPHGAAHLLKHIGVYCFSPASLERCAKVGSTTLSMTERLEQLAWLENKIRIKVIRGDFNSIGVDTPSDVEKAVRHFSKDVRI